MTSRRNLLAGAAAMVAGPLLPTVAAATPSPDDGRLLAAIAETSRRVDAFLATGERAMAAHARANADPEMPKSNPRSFASAEQAKGSGLPTRTLMRLYSIRTARVHRRHGYDTAYDEWEAAGDAMRQAANRVRMMRPATVVAAAAKARLFADIAERADPFDGGDLADDALAMFARDLDRLARRGAA